jgi:hypothetical protein
MGFYSGVVLRNFAKPRGRSLQNRARKTSAPLAMADRPLTELQTVTIIWWMITELLGHKDYLRILLALRKRKSLRCNVI